MQDHPIHGCPDGASTPPGHNHQLQRWLLFELVSYPPAGGDDLEYLARALGESRAHVEGAVEALVADGLAERDGEQVRASGPAWRFEALWPIRA
jgi:predicted transcriptional regulator